VRPERQVIRGEMEVVMDPVPKPWTVDRGDATRAVREVETGPEEVVAVPGDLRHDLAEAERDDREVVAAQAKRRQADQHSDDGCRDAGHEQDEPDREVEASQAGTDPNRAEANVVLR